MKLLAWCLPLVLVSAGAMAAERVYTPEGWYQLEDEGPAADSADDDAVAVIIVHEPATPRQVQGVPQPPPPRQQQPSPQAPAPQPAPPPPDAPSLQDEIARFMTPDCQAVRGRYLERVMELHGLDIGLLDPRDLAALTYQRSPLTGGNLCFGSIGCLPAPALAPLYGLPPIPPGALSYDLELKSLFRKLLDCLNQEQGGARTAAPLPPEPQPQRARPPANQAQPRPNSL